VNPLDGSWFTLRGKNMKKYVLLGVVALVMLLAVPAAMAVVNDQTILTGSINSASTIVVETPTLAIGTMDIGNTYDNTNNGLKTMVTVTQTATPSWTLNIADISAQGNPGHMWATGPKYLSNPLQVWNTASLSWQNVNGVATPYINGAGTGIQILETDFSQKVASPDVAGSYQITVQVSLVNL